MVWVRVMINLVVETFYIASGGVSFVKALSWEG